MYYIKQPVCYRWKLVYNIPQLVCYSTNGVFPHNTKDCRETADLSHQWHLLTDGYSQSKWVAEQLVARAGQRGLPVTIYRLGACIYTRNFVYKHFSLQINEINGLEQRPQVALCTRKFRSCLPTVYSLSGNLGGDRINAAWNPQDFTLLLLSASAKYGVAPDVDWDVEMTPVDFVAQFIVRLVQHPDFSFGKTLHIVNDKPLPSR